MSDKKISQFVSAGAFSPADLIPIVQGGANKKLTFQNLFGTINTASNFNTIQADIDLKYSGVLDPDLLFIDASTNRIGVGTSTPQTKLDVNGSFSTNGVELSKSFNTQTSSGVVSQTTSATIFDSITSISATLAAGTEGQKKTLMRKGTGTITLSGTNFLGFTNITFNSVGDTATLQYLNGNWYIINGYGVVIA